MRRTAVVAAAVLGVAGVAPLTAGAEPAHSRPQGPAKVAFAPDFPVLTDHQWGFRLGGFGGTRRGVPLRHVPVIFVHGNTVDAADWYPVRDAFRDSGWSDQELWALSYNGLGGNSGTALGTANPERDAEHREMGWDGQVRVTNNEVNVADLYDFIRAVQSYTGSEKFVVVAHSLGVTLARRTLKVHRELRAHLVAFVGIAGANHGTSLCPPGSEGNLVSCDEIAAGTQWLTDLNGPDGGDETYPPARWLTIYDGSGVGDPAFAGPTYATSPALKGAENRTFPGTYHNDLRVDPAIVEVYRDFIAAAEAGAVARELRGADTGTGVPESALPARGGTRMRRVPAPAGAVALADLPVPTDATPGPAGAFEQGGTSDAYGSPAAPAPSPGRFAVAPVGGHVLGDRRSAAAVWVFTILHVAGLALVGYDGARRRRSKPS